MVNGILPIGRAPLIEILEKVEAKHIPILVEEPAPEPEAATETDLNQWVANLEIRRSLCR
jgi:hypothetical protein